MNELRDPIVGDALRRLDVPTHAPDFWDRLDASLSGELPGEHLADHGPEEVDVDELDADVIQLGSAPSRRRPAWSRLPNLAVAAAVAAAVALVVGVAVLRPAADDESQVDSATVPDAESAPEQADPVDPDPGATAPSGQHSPEALASEWLTLLRDGEVEQAHALLDQSSQDALPLEEFRDVATGLAEGAGSFADLEPNAIRLIDDEGLAATAVVFAGDVEREGMIETAAFAVVVTGDPDDPTRELGVAFVLDGPTVEAVQRTQAPDTLTSPLELEVSPTAGATWAIVDGAEPQRIDSGEATVTVDVEAIAGPGTHTVVVISTEAGLYTSRAFTVLVP